MRRALAAMVDVAASAILAFLAFRLALLIEPCASGNCPFLAPLTVLFSLVVLAAYFGLGHVLWHATPGERVSGGERNGRI